MTLTSVKMYGTWFSLLKPENSRGFESYCRFKCSESVSLSQPRPMGFPLGKF